MYHAAIIELRKVPWNKGKLIGQKPPLKLKEIWAIRIRLQLAHRFLLERAKKGLWYPNLQSFGVQGRGV